MVFAPQSFAQKDDYSAINAKNCGLDVYYEVPGSSNVDTMREEYEKDWERLCEEHTTTGNTETKGKEKKTQGGRT